MLYAIIGIIAFIGLGVIISYNGFISLKNKCEEAFSTMDVYLKKRFDLIPNLVETVKGYAAHEQGTLEKVVQARSRAMGASSLEERQASENLLSGTLKSLFALSESYPELKADGSFINLQNQLQKVEEDISQARKYYNAVIKTFNIKVESFPSNLMALMFGFRKYPYFMADEGERQNVRVGFQ